MKQEHKDKISAAKKGMAITWECGRKFKPGHNAWNKGLSIKLNDALDKWRENGGEPWNKGIPKDKNPLTGRKHTDDAIKKMSEAAQNRSNRKSIKGTTDQHGHGKVECVCVDCKETILKRIDTLKGWSGRCLSCAKKYRKENSGGVQPDKKYEVFCSVCNVMMMKTKDKIKKWKGMCRTCFNENAFSSEAERERCRVNLIKQRELNPEKYIATPPKGEKHWNWQGGKSSEAQIIRRSLSYKQWRKEVFERDDYTCQFCLERGGELHADHIKPFSLFPELRLDVNNGRTLCEDCHKETDTYMHKINEYKKKLVL